MRPEAFTFTERGVARKTIYGYVAFFPEAVPRRIQLPSDVMVLLDEATGAVHRLGGVGRLIPNPHLLIGPHLRLEAVLSSRIYEAPRIFDAVYGPVATGQRAPDPPLQLDLERGS